jgi:hypothetical protein
MLCAVLPVASRILAIGLATSPAVPIAIPVEQIHNRSMSRTITTVYKGLSKWHYLI